MKPIQFSFYFVKKNDTEVAFQLIFQVKILFGTEQELFKEISSIITTSL